MTKTFLNWKKKQQNRGLLHISLNHVWSKTRKSNSPLIYELFSITSHFTQGLEGGWLITRNCFLCYHFYLIYLLVITAERKQILWWNAVSDLLVVSEESIQCLSGFLVLELLQIIVQYCYTADIFFNLNKKSQAIYRRCREHIYSLFFTCLKQPFST